MHHPLNSAQLANKKSIILGITGGIAAYKTVEIARALRLNDIEVQVVTTRAAEQFVTTHTLQAITGRCVQTYDSEWSASLSTGMQHIDLARWADLIVIAPASAHFIAKLAQGLADDLLTTLCLATRASIAIAPAMNQQMWHHPATQANVALLKSRGILCWGPEEGVQACGDIGPGRLLASQAVVEHIHQFFKPCESTGDNTLAGVSVLVTAGPTREPLDPIRYFSNRSSGKMGYALAEAAKRLGAMVTLVSGPTCLSRPSVDRCFKVSTACDMYDRVVNCLDQYPVDILIGVAAVADFRPKMVAQHKIKKQDQQTGLSIELLPNPDILKAVAQRKSVPFLVGFCAESEHMIERARKKRLDKQLDIILANRVDLEQGFESDENQVVALWEGGSRSFERQSKEGLAHALMRLISERWR